jgi:hypothetical protein
MPKGSSRTGKLAEGLMEVALCTAAMIATVAVARHKRWWRKPRREQPRGDGLRQSALSPLPNT